MARKKPIGLRLSPELIERVDGAKGHLSRAQFIENALEMRLALLGPDRRYGERRQRESELMPCGGGQSRARSSADVKANVRPIKRPGES